MINRQSNDSDCPEHTALTVIYSTCIYTSQTIATVEPVSTVFVTRLLLSVFMEMERNLCM